jgi:hypothetical protein
MSIQHDPVVAVPLAAVLWFGAVAVAAVAVRLWVTASAVDGDTEAPVVPPESDRSRYWQVYADVMQDLSGVGVDTPQIDG